MSLKHFHIVFILAAMVLSFGFGAWSMKTPDANVSMGVGSFLLGAGLVVYLVWFLKKKAS